MSRNTRPFALGRGEVARRPAAPATPVVPAVSGVPPRSQVDIVRTAQRELRNQEEYVREISRLWREAQQSFLAIGRYLVQAKRKLAHGEFQRMVDASLPFGRQTAYELRMIAEAVDCGRIPEPKLPQAASVAYQLATLKPDDLAAANQDGLVRPDLRRPEIITWKRERLCRQAGGNHEALTRRRARLAEIIRRHEEELEKARRELAQLNEAIGDNVIDSEAEE
ncbi:DUF3102 domain-containing protein [Belnapia sp. F-4-1]|uniref:DUF3102 domain-containing protein n=1 Tax=Belnapia sp. F-4-1 TaxID=1545443 RepID=UPI001186F5C1|nr:DUF3102 domain-containing protein [Belnapia sp. F-4-1]